MRPEDLNTDLDAAGRALAEGRTEEALGSLERLELAHPNDASVLKLLGVAFAQAGRSEAATDRFRRAITLAPHDPEAFYDFAVHLRDTGDLIEAEAMAQEAIRLDPENERAVELLATMRSAKGSAPFEVENATVPVSPDAVHRGPDDPVRHVLGLGQPWTRVGYVVLALSVLALVLVFVHRPYPDRTATPDAQHLKADFLSVFTVFLHITSAILTFGWTLIDLIDRRGRFIWLLPIWVLAFCGAAHAAPLALYLFFGRRFASEATA